MTYITRWNPRSPRRILQEFDRLFDDMLTLREQAGEVSSSWDMAVDVAEQDDMYLVKASVPGINPDDIEVTVTDSVLTIKGETVAEQEVNEGAYHLRERRHGQFSRSITLPAQVNTDAIEATCQNGVLTLHIPKSEAVKPKRIVVKTDEKVIEAQLE